MRSTTQLSTISGWGVVSVSDHVLVTGADGFVGSHLVERLVADGQSVVAVDLAETPRDRVDTNTVDYRAGDLTDDDFRASLIAEPYDRVYHLAAVVGVSSYVRDPLDLVEVNATVTRHLLDAVKDRDLRFVFTSTSEVYGKNPKVPWRETDDRVLGPPTLDRWIYSTSKSLCEQMIHGLSETAVDTTVVRPFNLYGPGQRPDFVVPAFVEAVVNDELPTVYGDGTQTRCFTYIDDFIEGIVRAGRREAGVNEVFNLGDDTETTIEALARTVLDIVDRADAEPDYVDPTDVYGDGYEDLDRRVPDVSHARDRLDWVAETTLEEGLEEHLRWGRDAY